MITVEVEKAPPFVALSYTWGDKKRARSITIDSCEARITVNLAEAIEAIFKFARSRHLMFWADSICINQADVQERSQQVRLMNTIYRSAELVTIWLGPAADDSDIAFKRIKEWSSRLEILTEQHQGSQTLAVTSIPLDDAFFFGPGERQALRAMSMICRRPWWSRAWVVQEGSVASKSRTLLFCGDQHINWASFRAALQITHHVFHFKNSGMSVEYGDGMPVRLDTLREDREKGSYLRLLQLLNLLRAYECEDKRDKIYAALGMAMDVVEGDIIPDYEKTYRDVCGDVIDFYVAKRDLHTLDFLGCVFHSCPDTIFVETVVSSQLPSWIPDWTYRMRWFPLEKHLNTDSFAAPNVYSASGSLPVACHIEGELMHLHGAVIDYVSEVKAVCEWNLHAAGLVVEKQWIPENPGAPYINGGTALQAFNHTIVADVGRRDILDGWQLSRGFQVDWDLLSRDSEHMNDLERERQSSMMVDIKAMTFGRRLFMTKKGYMGLGPAAAKVDDKVCLLSGGQVLYVLRDSGIGRFDFVGECYVHGLMDGEACKDDLFELRDIILT